MICEIIYLAENEAACYQLDVVDVPCSSPVYVAALDVMHPSHDACCHQEVVESLVHAALDDGVLAYSVDVQACHGCLVCACLLGYSEDSLDAFPEVCCQGECYAGGETDQGGEDGPCEVLSYASC